MLNLQIRTKRHLGVNSVPGIMSQAHRPEASRNSRVSFKIKNSK